MLRQTDSRQICLGVKPKSEKKKNGPDFYYCQSVAGFLMWGAPSDKRTGMSFTIAAEPRQRSHSRVRVPRDSWLYFTVSDSRLPQPGGPGPRIYIPPGTG
jgi:hypothetical protein